MSFCTDWQYLGGLIFHRKIIELVTDWIFLLTVDVGMPVECVWSIKLSVLHERQKIIAEVKQNKNREEEKLSQSETKITNIYIGQALRARLICWQQQ